MLNAVFIFIFIVSPVFGYSQAKTISSQQKKPDLFNSGFLDIQNSGQMNASARVFRIYIGEPKKFALPLSFYSGVSSGALNSTHTLLKGSEQLVLGLINPLNGIFNFSTENTIQFGKKSATDFSLEFQVGEKMLGGIQANTLKSFTFFSSYSCFGLLFKTGAWEKDKEANMGMFWVLSRIHFIRTGNSFQKLSGYPPDKRMFTGYSIGSGIDINGVLNIKCFYYRYIQPRSEAFDIPIFQLAFNYNVKSD